MSPCSLIILTRRYNVNELYYPNRIYDSPNFPSSSLMTALIVIGFVFIEEVE